TANWGEWIDTCLTDQSERRCDSNSETIVNRFASFFAAGLIVLGACHDAPAGPEESQPAPIDALPAPGPAPETRAEAGRPKPERPRTVSVLSQNLYVGADVDLVIGALAS